MVAIKPHAGLNGGEANEWKLTKKRELWLESGGERVFPKGPDGSRHFDASGAGEVAGSALAHAAKQAWLTLAEGNLMLLAAALGALSWPRSSRATVRDPEAARALAWLAGGSSLALFLAYALFRADPRYAAILFAFALPFAGRGLDLALDRIQPRRGKAWHA